MTVDGPAVRSANANTQAIKSAVMHLKAENCGRFKTFIRPSLGVSVGGLMSWVR